MSADDAGRVIHDADCGCNGNLRSGVCPLLPRYVAMGQALADAGLLADSSLRDALTIVLTEHRVWVEALTSALLAARAIEPHGSSEWRESGRAMQRTVLRVVEGSVAAVDAPTIEARIAADEAERDAALAAVERVRARHESVSGGMCFECTSACGDVGYPCPTIRALDGET